jgi:hypothetical protein
VVAKRPPGIFKACPVEEAKQHFLGMGRENRHGPARIPIQMNAERGDDARSDITFCSVSGDRFHENCLLIEEFQFLLAEKFML